MKMDLKIILCLITIFLLQYLCEAQNTTPEPSEPRVEEDMDVDEENGGKKIMILFLN